MAVVSPRLEFSANVARRHHPRALRFPLTDAATAFAQPNQDFSAGPFKRGTGSPSAPIREFGIDDPHKQKRLAAYHVPEACCRYWFLQEYCWPPELSSAGSEHPARSTRI